MIEWFSRIDIAHFWGYIFATIVAGLAVAWIVNIFSKKKNEGGQSSQVTKEAKITHKKGDRVTYNVNNDNHPKRE